MRIAIVEDDAVMRSIIIKIIADIDVGIIIDEFDNGRLFLQEAQSRQIMEDDPETCRGWDGIILDVLIPGATGLDVAKLIKTSDGYNNVPIIFVTGMGDVNSISKLNEYGLVMTKPYSLRTLKYLLTHWFNDIVECPAGLM